MDTCEQRLGLALFGCSSCIGRMDDPTLFWRLGLGVYLRWWDVQTPNGHQVGRKFLGGLLPPPVTIFFAGPATTEPEPPHATLAEWQVLQARLRG